MQIKDFIYYAKLGAALEKFLEDENNSLCKHIWGQTMVVKVETCTAKELIEIYGDENL